MKAAKQSLRLPVRFVDGNIELLYGGAIPVKENALAELIISSECLSDQSFLEIFSKPELIKILEEKVSLMVAISPPDEARAKFQSCFAAVDWKNVIIPYGRPALSHRTRFVPITLGRPTEAQKKQKIEKGGLWLQLVGMQPKEIRSSTVMLPEALGKLPARSLNHAYTMISERLETDRISHTGNIYDKVFYQDGEKWYPLGDLREARLYEAEREIINSLWKSLAEKFGLNLPQRPART